MSAAILTTLILIPPLLIGCEATSHSPPHSTRASNIPVESLASIASVAPYRSSNEPKWAGDVASPLNVPTPANIAEEVEEDEEEFEEDPAIEACYEAAEPCFSADGGEVDCLSVLATCLSNAGASDVASCIQGEADCLVSGVDSASCSDQAEVCLDGLE